jgi:hypothetical protein
MDFPITASRSSAVAKTMRTDIAFRPRFLSTEIPR